MDMSQCVLGRYSPSPQQGPLPPWHGGSGGAVFRELSASNVGNACLRSISPSARRGSLSPSPVRASATLHPSRGCSGAFHNPSGNNGPGWTHPDHAALSARVQSVLNKIDTVLVTAGKRSSVRPQQFAGASPSTEFADLLDRLAQLDMLLDELATMGHPRLGDPLDAVDHAVDRGASKRDIA